jgi:hypothetical protein
MLDICGDVCCWFALAFVCALCFPVLMAAEVLQLSDLVSFEFGLFVG